MAVLFPGAFLSKCKGENKTECKNELKSLKNHLLFNKLWKIHNDAAETALFQMHIASFRDSQYLTRSGSNEYGP